MAVGIAAHALRFFVYAIGDPLWLMVAINVVHGMCYAFSSRRSTSSLTSISPKIPAPARKGCSTFSSSAWAVLRQPALGAAGRQPAHGIRRRGLPDAVSGTGVARSGGDGAVAGGVQAFGPRLSKVHCCAVDLYFAPPNK